ncbi:hypothetical protein BDP27DRAFT_1425802 [Rhodocollybia butyracea]|uniref:Uncharacterized protein n=1 Tax=Rhodocollybia butyracea TaxID=206335 RepID=A0A9P5PF56_9AGAR|nr:hypothetical protein BDP27DRAFT_1425802 [Rhodocollybia butyracea]
MNIDDCTQVMDSFLKDPACGDLSQYVLNEQEWLAPKQLSRVLEIPHNFQQLLSKEKTPTLCDFLPSFAQIIELWEELQRQLPKMRQSIQAGLSKIKDYHKHMARVPAYALAMVINPDMKFDYHHQQNDMDGRCWAKDMMIEKMQGYRAQAHTTNSEQTQAPQAQLSEAEAMFSHCQHRGPQDQSVEEELNAYLADPTFATTTLIYWQEK